jgi:NACHT domain
LKADSTLDFERLPIAIHNTAVEQLGDTAAAQSFFGKFNFKLNEPNLAELEEGIRKRFYRIGGTETGLQHLAEEVRRWVVYRNLPREGGDITLADVKRAANWYQLQSLPQEFEIPTDYVIPSQEFHDSLIYRLSESPDSVTVICATPGAGKSTYVSKLFSELKSREVPVVRHHYFLSLGDQSSSERLDHGRAAESLMHDLSRSHSEALGELADRNAVPSTRVLRDWVERCGKFYKDQSKKLIIFLDGLDHVWRERRSIEELDKLVGALIPLPDGVSLLIATQPVDDDKLPGSLRRAAPRNEWLKLPLLGHSETSSWLSHHLRDFDEYNGLAEDDPRVQLLAKTLYGRSGGHPLHLRYTMKAVQERGLALTPDALKVLPGCAHANIVEYYNELWQSLAEDQRQILHLTTATMFEWPAKGIFECLDPHRQNMPTLAHSLRQVQHLLVVSDTSIGVQPFHSSLPAFVREHTSHSDYELPLKEKALAWLKSTAPPFWKWAFTWLLAAEMGMKEDLIFGPNRAWVVGAIATCRPYSRVLAILDRAVRCALEQFEFPQAAYLGLLKAYYVESTEPHQFSPGSLLRARLSVTNEPGFHACLRAHTSDLDADQISVLAEHDVDHARFYLDCVREKLWGRQYRTQFQNDHHAQQFEPLLRVAAIPETANVSKVVRFACSRRPTGITNELLSTFAGFLRRNRDVAQLLLLSREVHSFVDDTGAQVEYRLTSDERRSVVKQLVLLALENGTDCRTAASADLSNPFGCNSHPAMPRLYHIAGPVRFQCSSFGRIPSHR